MTTVKKLVEEFATNIAAQTDAISQGDSVAGNRYAKRYIRAFEALRESGDSGREALVPLLYEGRDDVRAMAAAFLLRYRYSEARRVLQELSRGRGAIAFEAGEALRRWDEGTWQLD